MKQTSAIVAGLLLLALAAGTGAFTAGDQIDDEEEIYLDTIDTVNSDAYAELVDGELEVDVDRANQDSRTWIDDVFRMGYAGDGTAEVWIEHDSTEVVFYDSSDREEMESETSSVEVDTDGYVDVGLMIDSGTDPQILEEVSVFARLHDEEEDEDDEDADEPDEPEADDDPVEGVQLPEGFGETEDVTVEDDLLEIDLGEISVDVDEARFDYSLDMEPGRLVAGESSTAVVSVENVGSLAGSADVRLEVDGNVVQTDEVDVEPGDEAIRSYVIGFDEPGEYMVSVENESTVVLVEERSLTSRAALVLGGITTAPIRSPFASLAVAAAITVTALYLIVRRRNEDR